MTTEHRDKEIAESIASELSGGLWNVAGYVLGQGALIYGSNKTVEYLARPKKENPEPQGFFSSVGKYVSKFVFWQSSNALAHEIKAPVDKWWQDAAPTAKKFMTPIIQKVLEPTIEIVKETLKKEGITLFAENPPAEEAQGLFASLNPLKGIMSNFSNSNPAPAEPLSITSELPTPELPKNLIDRFGRLLKNAAEYSKENAGPIGEYTADAFADLYRMGKEMNEIPGKVMEGLHGFCEKSGYPFHVVLPVAVGAGVLSYYGLKTLLSGMGNVINFNANTTSSANSIANNHTVIHLEVPRDADLDDETPRSTRHRRSRSTSG